MTVTVYECINEEWTRVTGRVACTEAPEWNQESQTRILVFAPGDEVTEDEGDALLMKPFQTEEGMALMTIHLTAMKNQVRRKRKSTRRFLRRSSQMMPSWTLRKLGMGPRTVPTTPRVLPKSLNRLLLVM